MSNKECWAEKDGEKDEAPEEEETKPGHQLDMGEEGEQEGKGRPQFSIWGTGWMVELLIEGTRRKSRFEEEDVLSDLRHKSLRCPGDMNLEMSSL